ncbi:hypothetical protein QTO34_008826 [Cnephaeus nilssonii]|uniref:Conserved oligomeric Golgi complex subunit 1 n=1 Tax=Cnephaeus nilssonii TaxID=3371016 RepID=A0AA40LGD2_CNENI|nr:hypothetical protein QTO34_008826 [Eptesicus nilssonii]
MAAAATSAAFKRLDLRDPAALFETHGAEEIRGLERQVRAEIEHKKEELRQMVGERYRDLIEAADTIGQMRRCAEGLVDAVKATDQYCARLRQAGSAAPRPPRDPQPQPSREKFYSMAAQIKLLLEIPEKIWSSMEASQHLHATQLYLLCCHLHSLLQLDSSGSRYSPVLSRFPILIRQVAAASHFRTTILHESKMLLKCQAVSDQAVAEALCSIMLLEESSPRQALADFLLARKAAIQKLLNQPHHEGLLPDPSLPCGLLFSTLETITGQHPTEKGVGVLQEEMKLCSWFKHLPASVVEFRPALRTLARPISQEYLTDTLQKWIHMCKEDIKNGITNLLMFVKSMKGLAGSGTPCGNSLPMSPPVAAGTWCAGGFWRSPSCCGRTDAAAVPWPITGARGSTSKSASNKHIHFEHNMSLFLWSESPDAKLKVKLDDLLAYLPSDDSSLSKEVTPVQAKNCAFDRYADAGTVQEMLRTHSVACIRHITDCIRAELQSIEEAVQGQQGALGRDKLHAAQWQEVKELLLQQSVMGYRVWSSAVVQVLAHGFAQSLLLDDAGSVLATATSWDELEIQEEAESGSSITSKIRLPPSLCQEINRVGGHALPKVTLQEMLKNCVAQVVAAYEKLSEGKEMKREGAFPMTQNRALQLLYDLRYLSTVLTAKGEEVKSGRSKQDSRIEKVADYLEALIDPFDLDVFTPHLNSNLTRLVQRTSVLFGLVTGTENQFTPRSSTFNSQEPHNILPLASSQIRFGLLPLSMTSTRKAKSTSRSIESKSQVSAEIKFIPMDPVPSPTKPPNRLPLKNR